MTPDTCSHNLAPKHGGEAGFTLVEILVALAILLVGLVSVLVLFPQSLSQANTANKKSVSADQAREVLGEIGQLGADALYYEQLDNDILARQAEGNVYGYSTTTQRLEHGDAESRLQRVTFTVTFPNGTSERYTTYVVNP